MLTKQQKKELKELREELDRMINEIDMISPPLSRIEYEKALKRQIELDRLNEENN